MPKLSIIIPVYNVEPYLRECLESVLQQDFSEMEIVCVDDCSTDSSAEILQEYGKKDPRIHIFRHERNRGLSAARNTGLAYAGGKYVWFVDSDDMIKPGACKKLYETAERNETDIIYFNMTFLNGKESWIQRREQKYVTHKGVMSGRQMFCLFQEDGSVKVETWRQFYKREFLLQNDLLFYEGILHEDMLFSFQAAMKAKRAADLDCALYVYRQRKDSISWGSKDKTASSLYVCLVNICSYWMTHDFSSDENRWIAQYIKGLYQYYLHSKNYQNAMWRAGGEKEKLLYEILAADYSMKIYFSEEDISRLRLSERNIVYGAGKIATEVLKTLRRLEIRVDGVAVTDVAGNARTIDGLTVKSIEEYRNDTDALIILGTDAKLWDEIIETLHRYHLHEYIRPQINQ